MFTRRTVVQSAALAPLALSLPLTAHAAVEDYPSGPLRAICPFTTGSGADTKIRFYANKLQMVTGKPVIVENKPGAMGNIGTETVARAKPDGYTIYISPASSVLAAAPSLFKNLNYDPIKDFEPITTLNSSAFVLCVSGDSPFKTVADLTAHLKEKGSSASYGTIAPPSLVAGEIYKAAFGLQTVEVKYRDQSGLQNDLFGGNLAFQFGDITAMIGPIKSGKFRALCTSSAQPLKSAPFIPGAAQAGIPNMDVVTWWAVHVPAGTPKPICDKLEAWFNKIVLEPDTIAFNESIGSDTLPGNAQMLRELMVKQTALWHDYARIANIKPE